MQGKALLCKISCEHAAAAHDSTGTYQLGGTGLHMVLQQQHVMKMLASLLQCSHLCNG